MYKRLQDIDLCNIMIIYICVMKYYNYIKDMLRRICLKH
jgi:hypothetical protein